MKYKKLTIETDGTSLGTKIFVNGEQLDLVQSIIFSANVEEKFALLNITVGRNENGRLKTKKIKYRDLKTEVFEEKIVVETEPLILERE